MTPPHIVVVGSINMDLVIRCDRLPLPGQTVLAGESREVCGGKGANQAVAAARAGGHVAMIGRVGDDAFARRLTDNLRSESIDCSGVRDTTACPSGLAVVAVDDSGENSIVVVPGANGRVDVADVRSAADVLQSADVILLQLEIPTATVSEVIAVTRRSERGVRIVLDPAPAPTSLPESLYHVDLICPNESEAAALVGHAVDSIDSATAAAKTLLSRGAASVAITMGGHGTLLARGDQITHVPAHPITAVDTTAAGDAFAGALAVRWAETGDLLTAVRFANAAGAIAASRAGAQPSLATRREIDAMLAATPATGLR